MPRSPATPRANRDAAGQSPPASRWRECGSAARRPRGHDRPAKPAARETTPDRPAAGPPSPRPGPPSRFPGPLARRPAFASRYSGIGSRRVERLGSFHHLGADRRQLHHRHVGLDIDLLQVAGHDQPVDQRGHLGLRQILQQPVGAQSLQARAFPPSPSRCRRASAQSGSCRSPWAIAFGPGRRR